LVDDVPVVANSAYAVFENTALTVYAPGVLGNDYDVDAGQTLTATLVQGPSHAATNGFVLNSNGSFSYTPAANFTGVDSFTYEAFDGYLNSTTATVTIT